MWVQTCTTAGTFGLNGALIMWNHLIARRAFLQSVHQPFDLETEAAAIGSSKAFLKSWIRIGQYCALFPDHPLAPYEVLEGMTKDGEKVNLEKFCQKLHEEVKKPEHKQSIKSLRDATPSLWLEAEGAQTHTKAGGTRRPAAAAAAASADAKRVTADEKKQAAAAKAEKARAKRLQKAKKTAAERREKAGAIAPTPMPADAAAVHHPNTPISVDDDDDDVKTPLPAAAAAAAAEKVPHPVYGARPHSPSTHRPAQAAPVAPLPAPSPALQVPMSLFAAVPSADAPPVADPQAVHPSADASSSAAGTSSAPSQVTVDVSSILGMGLPVGLPCALPALTPPAVQAPPPAHNAADIDATSTSTAASSAGAANAFLQLSSPQPS